LRLYRRGIFISGQGTGKRGLRAVALAAKGYGLRNLAYGTSGHREIVRQPGIISPWLGVSSSIAFMNQQVQNARIFIIHFKEQAEPYGGLASLCINP
jgi:hypothetical protein